MLRRSLVHPVIALILAAGAFPVPALASTAADDAAPNPAPITVPTYLSDGWGLTPFLVTSPLATTSPASIVNTQFADAKGVIPPPTPGYVISSTIVVELADPKSAPPALVQAALDAGATVRLHDGAPGFVLIDAHHPAWNITSAIALTQRLRAEARALGVHSAYLDLTIPLSPRTLPNDPSFPMQWSLHNSIDPLFDVNAEPAWDAGYRGQGVTVGVVDQGWQTSHPDFLFAYNAAASQVGSETDSHATSCAGIIGMRASNGLGGAGIAHASLMSRLYYGSSSINANAFGFRNDLNFIKSNSWGPFDNGIITYLPSNERTAIQNAITNGRGGLGTIFVWAAGNGANQSDRADYDPYATSRFTIAVGAIYADDHRSIYSESGACLLAAAQSDLDLASSADMGIFTTTPAGGYTSSFGGTSAACPLAAGVVALVLEANPALTWRDVQHVIVNSARWCDQPDPGWTLNGAGRRVNYAYGFGAMDAGASTRLASQWRNVPPVQSIATPTFTVNSPIPNNLPSGVTVTTNIPDDLVLEHVELNITINHTNVGDLRIVLTSPRGTESVFALPRPDATDNYSNYPFTTVRCWDERSPGTWTLQVFDEQGPTAGTFASWRLTLHGTTPFCAADWNRDAAVNSQDFFDFLAALFSGVADFNRTGNTDSQDFFDFLTAFFGSCD